MRRGFTMIELIFSLVIIAIVASIGTDIIKSVYERYVASRDIEKAQNDMRRALDQIANRLQYRIKNSTIGSKENGDFIAVDHENISTTYSRLEWIGIDYLSQRAGYYSGYLQFDNDGNIVFDPNDENISFLSGEVPEDDNETNRTIYLSFAGEDFRGAKHDEWGWGGGADKTAYAKLEVNSTNEGNLTDLKGDSIVATSPLYFVPQSAYALYVEDGNLTLAYEYFPWNENFPNRFADAKKQVLLTDVSTFNFREYRGVLRIILCVKGSDDIAGKNRATNDDNSTYEVEFCRERAIL